MAQLKLAGYISWFIVLILFKYATGGGGAKSNQKHTHTSDKLRLHSCSGTGVGSFLKSSGLLPIQDNLLPITSSSSR